MRFGQLSVAARLYVLGVYAAALAVAGAWILRDGAGAAAPAPLLVVGLTLAAALTHAFPVGTSSRHAHHISLPFVLAAVLLLPAPYLLGLLVAIHVAEYARKRRSWFAQVFNVAGYVLTAAASYFLYVAIAGPERPFDLGDPRCLAGGAAAVFAFAFVNRGLVSVAIWLGNGIPPHRQQMFQHDGLVSDFALLAVGLVLVQLALVTPAAALLTVAPLLLIYQTLELPKLRDQRRTDPLTGLPTAGVFADACDRELNRASRFGRPTALLVVDLDRLAQLNTEHGVPAGDSLIAGVADVLKRLARKYDYPVRLEGGRFGLLLPETGVEGASTLADRLRREVATSRFDLPTSVEPVAVTVSVGVAIADGSDGVEAADLIHAAESALREANRGGGNTFAAAAQPVQRRAPAAIVAPAAPAPAVPATADPTARPVGRATHGLEWLAAPWRAFWALGPRTGSIVVSLAPAPIAALLIAVSWSGIVALDPVPLFLLVGFVAAAEVLRLELFGRSSYSLSTVPILAAAVLLGPAGGLIVGGASQVVRGLHRRSRWNRVLFNVSTQALAGAAAGAVYAALARLADTNNVLVLSLPVVAAGLVYFLHTLLVAVGVGTEMRMPPLRVWAENSRWLWSHYAVLSVMGLLLAVAYREHGVLGAAAFAVPPLMMRFAAKQYVDHTVQSVRQLRSLNEQLSDEVTRRTAMEHEVARLAQEAADAEAALKLGQLKSEFVTIASHELRTPVTAILGFSELLVEMTPEADPRRELLGHVFDESRGLADLLNDLLDVSRLEAGRVKVDLAAVDLERLVGEVLATAAPASSAHRFAVDLGPGARWVRADAGKLKQILTNLVDNAVKYSPDGGDVRVSARPDGAGGVVVAVADDGIGISPELQERIFDRFHRVDTTETRTVRGTGLGLYIVRQLAELHGATIAVDSEPGRGSTFSIALAAVEEPEPVAAPARAGRPSLSAALQPAVT